MKVLNYIETFVPNGQSMLDLLSEAIVRPGPVEGSVRFGVQSSLS